VPGSPERFRDVGTDPHYKCADTYINPIPIKGRLHPVQRLVPTKIFDIPASLESIRVREDTYNDNLWGTNRNNFVDSTLDSSGLVVRVPNCGRADGQNCSYQCYQRATGC
jgi:hypothetical protein